MTARSIIGCFLPPMLVSECNPEATVGKRGVQPKLRPRVVVKSVTP